MVMASGRWLGVRLDLLASLLIGSVSLAAVLVSQDAGRYISSHSIINTSSLPIGGFHYCAIKKMNSKPFNEESS